MESRPQLGQPRPLSHLLSAVEFTVELQAQGQQFFVGEVESVAFSTGNGLEHKVFHEAAVGSTAEADAPRDATAGITGKPEGKMPRADLLVIEQCQGQILDLDEAVDHRAVDEVAHRSQWPWLTSTALAAETLTPLIEWRAWYKGRNHQKGLQGKGRSEVQSSGVAMTRHARYPQITKFSGRLARC